MTGQPAPTTLHAVKTMTMLLGLISVLGNTAPARAQSDPAAKPTQLMVVTTPGWDAVDGQLQRYERNNIHQPWHPVGHAIPVVVGKHGMGWGIGVTPNTPATADPIKQEGDGRAPAGIFELGTAFGYAPQLLPGANLHYTPLTATTECVDDPASTHYNRLVERDLSADWNSSEHMRSAGIAYQWGIVVNHNTNPPKPGDGSCIFLHIWSGVGHGTAGCTAMPQPDIEALLTWLDPERHPLLVQLPEQQYKSLIERWKLPTAPNPQTAH